MTTWQLVHESFRKLAFDKSSFDLQEAHWIRKGEATRVWEGVGCATFVEYLSMMLGYRGNTARDRIRTALALGDLPEIEDALAGGRICWSAARELTRVVTPETQADWLDAAEGHSVREIEDMVAGLQPGDRPGDVRDRGAERKILRFEVSGATYAAFREAAQVLTKEVGQSLSDDRLIDLVARRVLGGPGDDGRASYQIAITKCSDCARTFANAAGRQVQVDEAMVGVIACDSESVPVDVDAVVIGARATHVGDGGGGPAAAAGEPTAAGAAATHVGDGGGDAAAAAGEPVAAGGATHVGDGIGAHPVPSVAGRASQTVPPKTRRAVLRAHHNRCAAPGCRSSIYLDVHHIQLRSEGVDHSASNLVPLCSAHHRAVHEGRLWVYKTDAGIEFRHPDGTPYGQALDVVATAAGTRSRVFQALLELGFRHGRVVEVLSTLPPSDSDAGLMRAALDRLEGSARCW